MSGPSLRPLSLPEILDLPAVLMRQRWRELFPVAVSGSLVAATPALLLGCLTLLRPSLPIDRPALVMFLGMATGAAAGLGGMVVNIALVLAIRELLERQPLPGLGRLYRSSVRLEWIGASILAGLAGLIGLLLCILPGLLFAVLLALVAPAMVYENIGGADPLVRSSQLVRYRAPGTGSSFLRVAAVLLVVLLLSYAVSSVTVLPAAAVGGVLNFSRAIDGAAAGPPPPALQVFNLIAQFLGVIAEALVRVYAAGALTLTYLSLRDLREGRDIERGIESLRGPAPESPR